MKKGTTALIFFIIVGIAKACKSSSSSSSRVTKPVSEEEKFECDAEIDQEFSQLAAANANFFINLYKNIQSSGNILISPFSIFSGLSLLHLATRSETKLQYEQVLQYDSGNSSMIHKEARNILNSLERLSKVSNETFILKTANKIFVDSSFSVKSSYLEKTKCYYKSEALTLPLQSDPQNSANSINSWVSEKTNDRIKDLVSASSLGANTQCVLINTVYFKAPWRKPFKKQATQEGDFIRQDGTKLKVDMMVLEKYLSFANLDVGGMVIELDYDTCKNCDERSSEMAMYLFIPNEGVAWDSFENEIMKENIINGKGLDFDQESLQLKMPRFEIHHQEELVPTLTALGLDLGGDFSGLSDSPTQVSDVLHETYLKVDEEGSEGAAATAIFMSRMLFIPRLSVQINRTFFLSIVHKSSRVVVFAGKIDEPNRIV